MKIVKPVMDRVVQAVNYIGSSPFNRGIVKTFCQRIGAQLLNPF